MLCYQLFRPSAAGSAESCRHIGHLDGRKHTVEDGIIASLEPDEQNDPDHCKDDEAKQWRQARTPANAPDDESGNEEYSR